MSASQPSKDQLKRENEQLKKQIDSLKAQLSLLVSEKSGKDIQTQGEINRKLQEEKYRQIIEFSTNLFYIHNTDNEIVYLSPQCREFLDCKPDEGLVSWTRFMTDHPANKVAFDSTAKAIRTGKKQPPYEMEIAGCKGRKLWVEAREAPIISEGKTVAMVGSLTDITQRKKAEEALRENVNRYHTLFDTARDAIFIMEGNKFKDCNQATVRIFGCRNKKDIVDHTPWQFSPEKQPDGQDSVSKAQKVILKALKGKPQQFYWQHLRKNGEAFDAEVSLNALTIKRKNYLQAIVRDITERKIAEEALKDSENRYRRLYENIPGGVIIVDEDYIIKDVNQTTCEITGFSQEELIGEQCDIVCPKGSGSKECPIWAKGAAGFQGMDTFIKCKDGSKNPILKNSSKLVIEGRSYIMEVFQDTLVQKNIENALRESEAKFRYLSDEILDGVAVSIDGKNRWVNKAFAETFGYTREEMIGKSTDFVVVAEEMPKLEKWEQNRLRGKDAPDQYETLARKKDGSIINLEVSTKVIRFEGEQAIQTIVRDVTEAKKAERVIRENEERLRTLINSTPDIICFKDGKGRWLEANEADLRLFSLENVDYRGKTDKELAEFTHPGFREAFMTCDVTDERAWKSGKISRNEEIIPRPDGALKVFDVIKVPLFEENGERKALVVLGRDITARKEAERAGQISEERYRSLIENSNDAIYLLYNRKFEIINKKFELMFGYNLDEVNHPEFDFIHLVAPSSIEHIEERKIRSERGEKLDPKYEFTAITKSGEEREVETSVTYIPYKDGTATQGIIRDITERKQAEREIIEAKEQAEESDRLKSAFLANMSHEIRTPMNGILGFASLLKSPELSRAERDEYVEVIERSGKRMLNIINDLIDISKIEAGQMEVNFTKTNVNEQIKYLHTFFKPETDIKELSFNYRNALPDNAAFVRTDKEKLYAVLTNLIKNAIKFTHKGYINVGYDVSDEELEFYVEDSGVGIARERQEAVFERFIQADMNLNRPYEGAGLGLAITKAYVNMLGGKIHLESEPEKGSRFVFTLPFGQEARDKTTDDGEKRRSQSGFQADLTILITEDDDASAMYLTKLLENRCKRILLASSGKEAVEICRENNEIDLILMDIKLPDMDGYEATRMIRKFDKNVVIIAQTAYALSGAKEKALQAGCHDYMAKPVKAPELLKMLNKYFSAP